MLNEYQGYMPDEMLAEARRRALPAIAAYRDGGAPPPPPSPELVHEMMNFLACAEVADEHFPLFLEDLHLDGSDAGAVTWGDEIPDDVRDDPQVIVIGCGEAGLLAGIRLAQAGLPFTIVEKNAGPGGTWCENRYPGARVDVGSHFYCYSFEPADHWTEYFCQHPELREYFESVLDKHDLDAHCRFETEVTAATFDEGTGRWPVDRANPRRGRTDPRRPLRDQRRRFAEPAEDARHRRHGRLRRTVVPFGPLAPRLRLPGTRFALIGAGASGFQIAPTIADEVEHLTVFQRTAQWMFPNPMYHEPVPAGERGPCGTCRSTGGGSGS